MGRVLLKTLRIALVLFFVIFLIPLGLYGLIFWAKGWPANWRAPDWSSANILPKAEAHPEALIAVYAARSGRWRGIFAVHSWIVIKAKDAPSFERYEVLGWGRPVRKDAYPADGRWYSNEPELIGQLEGQKAEALIPRIRQAITAYPHAQRGDYRVWPGPNSNTFIASILDKVPELDMRLPPTAIGKDFPVEGWFSSLSMQQGFKVSVSGVFGMTLEGRKGFEINILGLVAGCDWERPAIKLPGFGRIALLRPS